jgi:hypothetical protein
MILSFSTKHKNGEPTYFIEKIYLALNELNPLMCEFWLLRNEHYFRRFGKCYETYRNIDELSPKRHTIRRDTKKRWKAGRLIHFVINSRSKLYFRFAPVLPCVSTQEIKIIYTKCFGGKAEVFVDGRKLSSLECGILAQNDGFNSFKDFTDWFTEDFEGVLIHWTNIRY